jgi:uncharacterized damage-inducible protein DinB
MSISAALLPEFVQEFALTRKVIERVPDARLDWTPHPKSYTLRGLTTHLCNLPIWAPITIGQSQLDLAQTPPATPIANVAAGLSQFDANVAAAKLALEQADDATLLGPWSLRSGSHTIFTLPKAAVLRTFVMSHSIHHRAQLTVYLRLCDIALPAIYGPTADGAG